MPLQKHLKPETSINDTAIPFCACRQDEIIGERDGKMKQTQLTKLLILIPIAASNQAQDTSSQKLFL